MAIYFARKLCSPAMLRQRNSQHLARLPELARSNQDRLDLSGRPLSHSDRCADLLPLSGRNNHQLPARTDRGIGIISWSGGCRGVWAGEQRHQAR